MDNNSHTTSIDTDEEDDFDELPTTRMIKDPVHDLLTFGPLACSIIDTPQFQRLRYLKQLGTSYFVFPGASHNRFEHSLGTAHVAKLQVLKLQQKQPRLKIDSRDVSCVEVAALCHDLGHGAFSHVFDNMFIPAARPGVKWCHELASEMMFDAMVKDNKIDLPEDWISFIKDLIRGEPNLSQGRIPPEKPFLFEIVANKLSGVDVDKFDYIIRDCNMVGESCTLNVSRLLESARVVHGHIAYNIKDSHTLRELFYSRYSLHKRVYNHKTAKAIEYMIIEALLEAEPVYHFSQMIDDPAKYLFLTDDVIQEIERSTDPRLQKSRDIISDLRHRRIPKLVDEKCLPAHYKDLWKTLLTPESVAEMSKTIVEEKKRLLAGMEDTTVDGNHGAPPSGLLTPKQSMQALELGGTTTTTLLPAFEMKAATQPTASLEELEELADLQPLTAKDIIVDFSILHFGMGEKDPLSLIKFYGKNDPSQSNPVRPDESGFLLPSRFNELILRCFARNISKRAQVQEAFRRVLETLPESTPTPTEVSTPEPEVRHSFTSNEEIALFSTTTPGLLKPKSHVASGSGPSPTSGGRLLGRHTMSYVTEPNSFQTIKSPKSPSGHKRKRSGGVASGDEAREGLGSGPTKKTKKE